MATPSKIYLSPSDTGRVKFKAPTKESAAKASELLQHNHDNHHVFFNDKGFHNHIVHHILTLYGLGASAAQMQAHYERDSEYQRPPFPVVEKEVTDMAVPGHFQKYMAQEKYYHDFVVFFQKEMEQKGWENVVNEYLFSGTEQADDLLARHYAGLFHPLIHLGFGIEFRQPAIIAEALAQAAVHSARDSKYLLSVEALSSAQKSSGSGSSKTLLQLLDEIHDDTTVRAEVLYSDVGDFGLLNRNQASIAKYASQWSVPSDDAAALARKTTEMTDAALFFTLAAQNPPKQVRFDFFFLHAVTSSIFFPVFNAQPWLSAAAKSRLLTLKGYLDLTVYASQGPPSLRRDEITSYVPARADDPALTTWNGALERLCGCEDDGHAIKFGRAIKNAEMLAAERGFQGPFSQEMYLTAANMAADSMEAPAPRSKWVRGVGFPEAWEQFEDRPGKKGEEKKDGK